MRVNNYKILNNGLALDIKLKHLACMCYLCKKQNESIIHLFTECEKTKEFFCSNKILFFKNKIKNVDKNNMIYHKDLDFDSSKLVSIFNLAIWKYRNCVKNGSSNQDLSIFKNILYALNAKYFV